MRAFAALMVALLTLGFAFATEARRLGGARNLGTQRQAVTPQQPAPRAPARQQTQQQAGATTAHAQPAAAGNKWLGPLAGLALDAEVLDVATGGDNSC